MLEFVNLSYVVKVKKGPCDKGNDKTLVRECSARIPPGEVLALMGPSGAGKTTLLNALTLEPSGGTAYGKITLNGHPFTLSAYMRYAANVAQSDTLWGYMTTKEHLTFATDLNQSSLSKSEREAFVDDVLKQTGMESVADVKAGNQFFKGLSGGQKRRLSLGIALCKKPMVIFLDEPTSGLDAAAAASIMKFLKASAERANVAIICTIHQPSSSVFAGFDSVCFLTGGRMAYVGKAAEVTNYCESVGYPIPPNTNPADYVLDLINKDFSDAATVEKLVSEWRNRRPEVTISGAGQMEEYKPVGVCSQLGVLFRKHLILTRRDPLAYLARIIGVCLMTSFFGVIYIEQREPEQDQVFNRFCYLFWLLLVPSSMGVTVVYAMNMDLMIVKREMKDGMYSSLAYAIVKTVIEVPMIIILTFFSLVPAAYPIANFEYSRMFEMLVVCTIQLWSMECLAQANSIGDNAMLGMLNFLQGFNMFMLFCGLPLQPSTVTWVFRWAAYVSPLRWGLSTMTYYCFIDMTMVGAVACPTPDGSACGGRAFFCNNTDDPSGLQCYGRNGREVLSTLGERFELLTPDYDWQLALVLLAVTTSCFKLLYILGFYFATHKFAIPKAAESAPAPSDAPQIEKSGKPEDREFLSDRAMTASFSRLGATLEFTDVSYVVKTKKGEKTLIQDCSAKIPAGEVLALMGPSGAGKTTLLNALTMQPNGGTAYGRVTLNGQPFTLAAYKQFAANVAQSDTLWAHLTTREHLQYATQLFQPDLKPEKMEKFVNDVLNETGMEGVANVKAGNEFFKGLSGGQKRRLSLGVALCKKPHIVFLDEPTSGLDAAAAASIMVFLKNTATRTAVAIICTIHQPSSSVFAGFDSVCFLTGGKMAFVGKASDVIAYFDKVGRPMPPNMNPADYMLDLINKDFSDAATVDHMLNEWDKCKPTITNMEPTKLSELSKASVLQQTKVLFKKHITLTRRDPLVYFARMAIIMINNVFITILYIEGRDRIQTRALSRFFYLFFVVAIPGMFALVTVLLSNIELKVVKREVKDGAYPALAYGLVGLVIQIPFMFALGFCNAFPSMYPMMDLAWDGFGNNIFALSVGLWALDACAHMQSVQDNPLLGMMGQMNVWFFSFCYAGVWLPVDDIIWPFRVFCYILPYRWQLPAVAYNMMAFTPPYSQAYECNPTTGVALQGPMQNSTVVCNGATPDENGYGFYCEAGIPPAACYGRTGPQILDSFGTTFRTMQSTDPDVGDYWFLYSLLLVAMALTCKLIHFIAIVRICGQAASVSSPNKLKSSSSTRDVGPSVTSS